MESEKNNISVEEFAGLLGRELIGTEDNWRERGQSNGWLDALTLLWWDKPLERRTAVAMLHMFLRNELNIPDLENAEPECVPADLYECRICTQHILEVLGRGLMDTIPARNDNGEQVRIFGLTQEISLQEVEEIIKRLQNQKSCRQ